MTYMFQYPQFVRISMRIDNQFKKYGLHAYSEGHFTERARNMQFKGIPVLFIPGNAGSYKQVRSLASVALRKALHSRPGFHFDYFTIDYNEELSGLNGALLHDQVLYAQRSIYRILELYASNLEKPTSIILIGHSMGGIVAEGLISVIPDTSLISLVITLASPHKRPPLFFDSYLYNFYTDIKSWDNKMNKTFIAVSGGFSDFLVAPHLTSSTHLSVVTTHIPKVWLPMDHLCILWCKQLVLVLNRALFNSIDSQTRQISQNKEYIISVFKHYLLRNSGIKINLKENYNLPTPIDERGEWIERLPRQYSVELAAGTRKPQWYMIRRADQPMHEMLSIMALNLELTNWIFACSAHMIRDQSRVCDDAVHLSHLSEIVPSLKYKRRFLHINLHQLNKNLSHVVVKVPATSEPITLHVDVHSEADRKIIVDLPVWSLKNKVIIDETPANRLYYEIHFPNLYHLIQSYSLFVQPLQCNNQNHHASASLSVPWSNLDSHAIFSDVQHEPMTLRLYSNKPSNMADLAPFVRLLLDPNCRYTVSVKISILNMFGQFARFYSPFIFANIVVITLLSLKSQLFNIENKEKCSLFFTALMTDTKPFYVVPVAKIMGIFLGSSAALKILPETDIQVLDKEGVGTIIIILLYIISIGMVWILTMALVISIFCFESTVHKIFLKIVSRSVAGTSTTDWILKGLKRFPCFLAVSLISLSISTCGGLSLCIGLIFYFLKLSQMAQDVVEDVVTNAIKTIARKFKMRPQLQETHQDLTSGSIPNDGQDVTNAASTNSQEIEALDEASDTNNDENDDPEDALPSESNTLLSSVGEIIENSELYFHFTIFCLWFLVTCINFPTVLRWAHNFKYSTKLEVDPSFIPGVVFCACAFVLWEFKFPIIKKKWYKPLGYIIYFLSVFSFMYGIVSIYRLNYVLTAVIALITLHQMFAPKRVLTCQSSGSQGDDGYEKVKAKLDALRAAWLFDTISTASKLCALSIEFIALCFTANHMKDCMRNHIPYESSITIGISITK
ncbi:hypothetical protein Trydic_g3281 [Trypoxylus dichotomus]